MRLAFLGLAIVACTGGGYVAPAEPMPLPPSRDEVRREGAPAGDERLRVIDLEPIHGPAAGGGAVRIRGANFRTARTVTVWFAGAEAAVLRLTDDEIDVQAPAGSPGELADVTVTFDPGGDLQLRGAYTYDR